MTPRKRVEAVLRHEKPDKIPLTMYENKIPQCSVERQLRNDGLCIVNRTYPVFKTSSTNVKCKTYIYYENGEEYRKNTVSTPVGELSTVDKPAGFTSWHIEKIFKTPEDYKPLLFMVKDIVFEPCYEIFAKAEKQSGEDITLRVAIDNTPLQQIMVNWMGVETFAVEWSERRDEIEKIYKAMVENHRKIYPIIAKSPALHVNYGGNETGDLMGKERFEKYVLPLYNEAAEILHKCGKLIGAHLDGNNKIWADLLAESKLDYIEAFSPSPDTDMTIQEAFSVWHNKVLWINFPSSLQLASIKKIEETTREIIESSLPDKFFIIGITETIPEDRWQENMLVISRIINSIHLLK
ncbi:MAG: uroporphyrinogen decarboxylase family protein [Candidatus Omnitrophica bacterium]|nr:uroporphyrinogen decarboxylase family protein [Candidatus Omnitrophota bacterium]